MPSNFDTEYDTFTGKKVIDLEDALKKVQAKLGKAGEQNPASVEKKLATLTADVAAKADAAATTAALAGKAGSAHLHPGVYAGDVELAALLDPLVVGAITRDPSTGAATSAGVVWPNGDPGTYTATVLSSSFPGAVDAYTVTKGSPVTRTFTQPAVTRDANGAVTNRPAITVA